MNNGSHREEKIGKILLLEDDPKIAKFISDGFIRSGFEVDRLDNGRDGILYTLKYDYSIIILDRGLPLLDGMSMLRSLRATGIDTPVIILSAMASVEDRIEGLTNGADDYLIKPFAFEELLARTHLQLRKRNPKSSDTSLTLDKLRIDLIGRKAFHDTRELSLQPREFSLLEFFIRNANLVVTRTMILEKVWGYSFDPGTNVIDVHISHLRQKLTEGGADGMLQTVRGVGYKLSNA